MPCSPSLIGTAHAESLSQAFVAAYRTNPTIDAQRARLRALDETVTIARSGYRPQVSATSSLSWDRTIPNTSGTTIVGPGGRITTGGETRTAEYGLALSQALFTGFQVTNRVRGAEAQVRAERERLRAAQHALFLDVVSAYTGILAAQRSIRLFEVALSDANRELTRARRRLSLQETTRTDVAQAEALRAVALADLAAAKGRLRAARAEYVEVVGHAPAKLRQPRNPQRLLPNTLNSALDIAMREHPGIVSALYVEQAARNSVDEARGRLLPQVDLQAAYGKSHVSDNSGSETTSVSANLRIPIYAGGANHAAVRQAKQIHVSNLQVIAAERARVRRAVAVAWSRLQVARQRLGYEGLRIKANRAAIAGIRKEESVGQRTLNDLFLVQRELLRAETDQLTAQRENLLASYQVLADIGRLNAKDLFSSETKVYDPSVHYHEVRRKWFGISITYPNGHQQHLDVSPR